MHLLATGGPEGFEDLDPADRDRRLGGALAALHRSVRDRVAEIISSTVADVVRQAVRNALDPPPVVPAARRDAYDPWAGPAGDEWADEYDPIDDGGPDARGDPGPVTPAAPPGPPPQAPGSEGRPHLAAAAAAGLRAAGRWRAGLAARRAGGACSPASWPAWLHS